MEISPVSPVLWGGVIAISVACVALTYRVGRFTLMPGEWKALALNGVIALAALLGAGVVYPILTAGFFGSPFVPLIVLVAALGALVLLTRRRRAQRVADALERASEERKAEYVKRVAFMRSPQGRGLFVAWIVSMLIWAFLVGLIRAAS